MIDRFGREGGKYDGNNTGCSDGGNWCYGTIKGITAHIDYIKGMGFDCVWITPPVKNFAGDDSVNSSCGSGASGYAGYWAEDWYSIDPNFGTEADLKELSATLHSKGMCLVLDIVANHVRPLHSTADVAKVNPFNKPSYFHQKDSFKPYGIGTVPFDEYTAKYCNWPNALQGMGPGTLCYLAVDTDGEPDYTNGGNYCNNYKGNPFGEMVYNNETYLGADAAGPPDLKYCEPGNYDCTGYNEENLYIGWFYDLGDLNQSVPFVRDELLKWAQHMVDTYDVDSIRLDTAAFMKMDFLHLLQKAVAPVQIHGEITTTNLSYHASSQRSPPNADGMSVLHGSENFPLTFMATAGYCGLNTGSPSEPIANMDLTHLGKTMKSQISSGLYATVHSLMNFMSQQDSPPVANYCLDESQIRNSLTWVMFCYGIPVVAWGVEQGATAYRDSLWQTGYNTSTWEYKFIKKLNLLRASLNIKLETTTVVSYSSDQLIFFRGGEHAVWIFTNNFKSSSSPVKYSSVPPAPSSGMVWTNVLTGQPAKIESGSVVAPSSEPLVLVQQPA